MKNKAGIKKEKEQKPIKEIGIGTILGWILAILAIILGVSSAIVTIKSGKVFIGILFLVLTLLVFVPRKYLRITKPLKVALFIIGYLAISGILGIGTPAPEQQYEYYSLTQPFILRYGINNFSVIVTNTSTSPQAIIGGQTRTSPGMYLSINGRIKNLQKAPVYANLQFEMKDSKGNAYTLIGYNIGAGELQPDLDRDFSYIFEVPKDVSGLKVSIKDKTEIIKVIGLGI